ncbi:hypothetical protein HJFPF1_10515 [Paramyrothecium foliicola]|nr:hypothetical protein HJFPF1_10515 [Paramyrothecium foliicola]
MHIISILTSTAVIFAAGALATCHRSGITWPDRFDAKIRVQGACTGGAFKGTFAPGERKYACFNSFVSGVKHEFSITNLNTHASFDLKDEHCMGGLWDEIDGCSRGGVTRKSGWEFSSDPNSGRC